MQTTPNRQQEVFKRTHRITREELERFKTLDRDSRVAICRRDYALFSAYYFAHTKGYPFANFHYNMFNDFSDLDNNKIDELADFMFRESAKTSLVKEYVIHCICYHTEDYIVWDSYDLDNAERALFDIIVELQTNLRIKQDFGELYNSRKNLEEITQKRQDNFVTNHIRDEEGEILKYGVRVEAHSTQESARGFIHNSKRPGLLILDDFETKKTIRSEKITQSIWEHMQELKAGLSSKRSRIIYNGNYISQFANVQKIIDRAAHDHKLRVRIQPVIKEGIPTWPEKYVLTDAEALQYMQDNPTLTPKVSLETKKRSMWSPDTGDLDWEAEMLCNPIDNMIAVFKRDYFVPIAIEEVLRKRVACFVILDPALSEKDDSDDTGVAIIWVDEENKWYSKVFKLRLNSLELTNFLFSIDETLIAMGTPPRRIGIEKEKYYGAVYPFLKEKMRLQNKFLPMMPIEIKGRNKLDRITNALQYRYETQTIYHVIGGFNVGSIEVPALMNDYEMQALRFPAGGHDDMLDAHAYGADIVRFDVPESESEKRKRYDPYSIDYFVQRIEDRNKHLVSEQQARLELAQEREYMGLRYEEPVYDDDDEAYYNDL